MTMAGLFWLGASVGMALGHYIGRRLGGVETRTLNVQHDTIRLQKQVIDMHAKTIRDLTMPQPRPMPMHSVN